MTGPATRSRPNRRSDGSDRANAPRSETENGESGPAANDQSRFGNAAVVRANAASARSQNTEGNEEQSEEASAEQAPQETAEQRRIRRYAAELQTPEPVPAPDLLPPILLPPPAMLTIASISSVFRPPRTPDFARLSCNWPSGDPAENNAVRRLARAAYADVLAATRSHHDLAASEANMALQSISSSHLATRSRLQNEFLRTDFEVGLSFNQSLNEAAAGTATADQLILRNYARARRALSGAAASSKRAIQANKDDSERQISDILRELGEGFVKPLSDARTDCREQSNTSRQALQSWKRGIDDRYPVDHSRASKDDVRNEAKKAAAPGMADGALDQLREQTTSVVRRFTTNITSVRNDIDARVTPSLRAHTSTMVERGNEDVDDAFNRAFGALKRQANQAREAIVDSHTRTIQQLTALRNAERERLQMLMQQTLDSADAEAEASAELVVETTNSAMPHYAGASEQLADSMSEAAERNAASLRNMAGVGASQVRDTVAGAYELQSTQLDTAVRGTESSFFERESQIRIELMQIAADASGSFRSTATSGSEDALAAAGAMTEGFMTMSEGVTAAAAQWLRPLDEAFSEFLGNTRADLTRGRPAFISRVNTARSDFLRFARAQGNPARLFRNGLLSVATSAFMRVLTGRMNLAASLDAGIFDVIDETGVGNALRGLTALQGQWIKNNWPWNSSNWPSTIPEGTMRHVYADVTGSKEYSLEGHLKFALGDGSHDYNAAMAYLAGNAAEGAMHEMQASVHWYNDEEARIENIQRTLTTEQLSQLRGMEEYTRSGGVREEMQDALDGTDLNVFDALDAGNHARADAYRMLDRLNASRDQHQIDETQDILAEYSQGTEWGGEQIGADERRTQVQLELADIRGTSREELEAQAAERNREREAAAREEAQAQERARERAPAPSDPTTNEALQMCVEGPAANASSPTTIEATQLESRLPSANATSTSVPATGESTEDEASETQEQRSLADRWMRDEAPPPATISSADIAAEMFFDYATRDIEQVRSTGEGGTYTVTLSMTDRQRDLARALIFHGEGTPEARAARLGVEVERRGEPNMVNLDKALVDPRLNPDYLAAIDDPAARERIEHAAELDRQRTLAIFARDYGGMSEGTTDDHKNLLVGQLESAFGTGTAGAQLAELLVREDYPTPATAARAVEYAIEGAGTDNELYFRFTERMNRDDFQEMRAQYKENTGNELYDDLGLFGHGWFGDFSGDDRLRAERGTLGKPRNDRERAEVGLYAIHQQREETGILGAAFASGSMQETMMDLEEADLNAMIGGPIEFGPEAQPIWTDTGNFDTDNNFRGDVALLRARAETAQLAARNYSAKVDQLANFAATTIAIVGAVVAAVATVLTGGAASPLLLASIAAITGLTAMGAQYMIKGGRYGWEQAVTDLGMTAVQALTAGVGQGLALASRGGMQAVKAGMKAGLSMSAARELARGGMLGQMGRLSGSAFVDKVLIGMGTGALGSTGTAALDERTWAQGGAKGVENLFSASFRGMISGGVTAGVSNAIEDVPLGRLSKLVGNDTIGDAIGASTNIVGRGVGKGLTSGVGAFAGRAAELSYESARGTYTGDAGDIFVESSKAGGMSLLQSIGEGGAEARAQAIYNARYGGQPPIQTERAVARAAEAAETRRTESARAAADAETAGTAPRDVDPATARPIGEADALETRPRHTDDADARPRDPAADESGGRRPADEEDIRRARRDEEESELEDASTRQTLGDEADVIDLDQTRRALEKAASEPIEPERPPMRAKAGAAAAIEESQMRLLDTEIETHPTMLRDAAGSAIGKVSALSDAQVSTGGDGELRVRMVRPDGGEVSVKVEFGDTQGGDVASFRVADPGDDVAFVVTLSTRAPQDVHARAIAHELAEIRVHGDKGVATDNLLTTTVRPGEDASLSAHDVGRIAELEVLASELAATRTAREASTDPVERRSQDLTAARLLGEIDTLGQHLGLSHAGDADVRVRSALAAVPEGSAAATELVAARARADALGPARAIDADTRLTARDLDQLANLDRLAADLDMARVSGDAQSRAEAMRKLDAEIARLGLNDSDEATQQRIDLALSALPPNSPARRALAGSGAGERSTRLNDALRPGLKPDDATVLSPRDKANVTELASALRSLSDAEKPNSNADPAEIARLRHEAQSKAAEMGLVHGGEAAEARSSRVAAALADNDLDLIPSLTDVRKSAADSALLTPRRGTLEDLPLLARQIAEARAMGKSDLATHLIETAGLRLERAGVFDPEIRGTAEQRIAGIIGGDPEVQRLAVDAFERHSERLRAEAMESSLDSVRVSRAELEDRLNKLNSGEIPLTGADRTQIKADIEALDRRIAKLEAEIPAARRVAFRPDGVDAETARTAADDDTAFPVSPRVKTGGDFAGSGEQVRLTWQRYGDSPMFQSWQSFKRAYMEQNPSVKANTIRSNTKRNSLDVVDALELERLFSYWMRGRYVNEGAPRGRALPDLEFIAASKGTDVTPDDPATGAPIRLSDNEDVRLDEQTTMTPVQAAQERRKLMQQRDIAEAHLDGESDPAVRQQLDERVKALGKQINDMSEAMGEAAGLRFAQTLPGGADAAEVGRGSGVTDIVHIDPSSGRVSVIECKGGTSQLGSRMADVGGRQVRAEQTTPEYLRSLATEMTGPGKSEQSRRLGEAILHALDNDPPGIDSYVVRQPFDNNDNPGPIEVTRYPIDRSGR